MAISQPKIKLQNRRLNPTGHQDPTHIAVVGRPPSTPFATAQASLRPASVFFYRTIIITEVDDDGMIILLHNHPDSGRRCRGSGRGIGGVGRHSGREEWLQLDCHSWQKNHGKFGGDSTIIYCTHCRRLFLFSPYSNYHTFKYIWMSTQRFKWQHTTHATT